MSAHSQDYSKAAQHAQRLTEDELAQLVAELAVMLSKRMGQQQQKRIAETQTQHQAEQPEQLHNVMEFKGVAKDLWSDVNVEEYIKEERASWRKRERDL